MSFSRRRIKQLAAVVAVGCAGAASVFAAGVGRAAATSTVLKTYGTAGKYLWTVPTGVTSVTFDVYGASAGNVVDGSPPTLVAIGGAGGEAKATFPVKPGEQFEIVVGGRGSDNSGQFGGAGGFNGGGSGAGGTATYGGPEVAEPPTFASVTAPPPARPPPPVDSRCGSLSAAAGVVVQPRCLTSATAARAAG